MSDRIDGWKAIGAYFGRDRTTAIRWANERGLPVHAIPGGKTRSVYAYKRELDAWRGAVNPIVEVPAAAGAAPSSIGDAVGSALPFRRQWTRRASLIGGLATMVPLVAAGTWHFTAHDDERFALPTDPGLARRFIEARDELARRDAGSLTKAIADLRSITRADPKFAGAHASLAEALVLASEYGSVDDAMAMPLIERAARRALTLDPQLASARRSLAFFTYWRAGDAPSAAAAFRLAIAQDEKDGLTHLWYANVLADNGDAAAAAREFDAAKLLLPGMPSVRTDEAWAIWSAGDDRRAETILIDIARLNPTLAAPHDCLSVVALARGDLAGYSREVERRAALRSEPTLSAYALAVRTATDRSDIADMVRLFVKRAGYPDGRPAADMALVAFLYSALGLRAPLLDILRQADRQGVPWRGAGFRLHMARRWRGDAELVRLLDRRAPPPLA